MTGSWPRDPLSLQKKNVLMEVLPRAGAVWYGHAMTAALESSLMPSHVYWRCVLSQTAGECLCICVCVSSFP